MSSEFRQQLLAQFEQKETDELLAIWQENDRFEWSPLTFEVVEEILRQRLGEIPTQNEPILEHLPEPASQMEEDIDPSSPLYPFLAAENAPVLYEPRYVLRMEHWLNRLAWAFAGVRLLSDIFSYFPYALDPGWLESVGVMYLLLIIGNTIVNTVITFVMLKALAFILKMLMQMEFSSRGIGRRTETVSE